MYRIAHFGVWFKGHEGPCHVIFYETGSRCHVTSPSALLRLFRHLPLPVHNSQPPPFSPPQLPLMALRPFITPILMPVMTSRITIKLSSSVVMITFILHSIGRKRVL